MFLRLQTAARSLIKWEARQQYSTVNPPEESPFLLVETAVRFAPTKLRHFTYMLVSMFLVKVAGD